MRHEILAAMLVLVALPLAACGRHVEFQDNFSGLLEERIQRPYAVGTTATLTVQWSTLDRVDGWTAQSENPDILEVSSQTLRPGGSTLEIGVRALAEGETRLLVTQGTEVVGTAPMRVVRAVQLQLLDHALQKTKGLAEDVPGEVHVVAGQTMAVEARYLDAAHEHAWGRGLVTWPEVSGLRVWTDSETLGRDAEYVLVQPSGLEAYDLPLGLSGEEMRTLRVVGVPEDDIVRIEVLPSPENNAKEGDYVCGGLLAYDAAGNRVFGAPADWTVGGGLPVGSGDLLCYQYAPDEPAASVTVRVGATRAQLLVRGKDFVAGSTATIGCSVGGPAASSAAGAILTVLALVLLALRLRRLSR